jgi:ketosteroid isomerase-like protein
VRAWIDGYVRAWNSNDPADIRALFTQDAAYYTEPYGPPWEGRDEIVRQWLDRKDGGGVPLMVEKRGRGLPMADPMRRG